jgi:hypothetical protein
MYFCIILLELDICTQPNPDGLGREFFFFQAFPRAGMHALGKEHEATNLGFNYSTSLRECFSSTLISRRRQLPLRVTVLVVTAFSC